MEEMVRAQDADVVNDEGEDVSEKFLETWSKIRAQHSLGNNLGVAWRWAVTAVEGSRDLEMIVQALPCSMAHIKANSILRDDNVPALEVANFKIAYNGFESEEAAGPVPVFFSEDPESTASMLKDSPDFALSCLQALASRLLALEKITRYG